MRETSRRTQDAAANCYWLRATCLFAGLSLFVAAAFVSFLAALGIAFLAAFGIAFLAAFGIAFLAALGFAAGCVSATLAMSGSASGVGAGALVLALMVALVGLDLLSGALGLLGGFVVVARSHAKGEGNSDGKGQKNLFHDLILF